MEFIFFVENLDKSMGLSYVFRYVKVFLLAGVAIIFLACMNTSVNAANKIKPVVASKERLVLMPVRVNAEDTNLQGAMETAVVEGLQNKYEVLYGEQVVKKTREIFKNESKSLKNKECDETRCMQDIAVSFQSELIATTSITKRAGGYFLALSIQNIFDNKVVLSKSLPCENCSEFDVVYKLKELSGNQTQAAVSNDKPEIVAPIKQVASEITVWDEIQRNNSENLSSYQNYLKAFPKSQFKSLALVRIAKLKKQVNAVKSKTKNSGNVFKDCSGCPEMIVIPAGGFEMGSDEANVLAPKHTVNIEKPFAMGRTEVTQGQWKWIMGNNPSSFKDCGENCPVENISWLDANEFIKKINAMTGKQYRMPSEAEWEYACHAGNRHDYCGSDNINHVGWYGAYANEPGTSAKTTNPVALKQANQFGLYDMSGNVYEWVEDHYHDSYIDAPVDGSAWRGEGELHVLRGGAWSYEAQDARAVERFRVNVKSRYNNYGFRLVRELP